MIELAAIITGAQAVGLPGLGSVLSAVSGYQNEQAKALNAVRKDVRGLVMQNYLTGLEYLRSATRNEVEAEQSQQFLQSGLRSLREASGVFEGTGDHFLGSSTAMYLASTYATVGPGPEARHWAQRAHQEAVLAAEDMANHLRLLAEQAAAVPAAVWAVLGGDFNTGQDDPMCAGLVASMSVVAGNEIDLVYVGRHRRYLASGATVVPCKPMSDHDPWRVDLELVPAPPAPAPPGRLMVHLTPAPLRFPPRRPTPRTVSGAVQVTITATDAGSGALRTGTVRVDATAIGGAVSTAPTGQALKVPFRSTVTVDPETHEREIVLTMARATVSAAGYRDREVTWEI